MGLFHNLMNKLDRYRLIPDRATGEDYMKRYYLFLKDRQKFPLNVTLHEILRSDDPIFHDHPWPYMTIILKGGYFEHTPVLNDEGKVIDENKRWCGPGTIIKRKAHEYHWLELDKNVGTVTTLFIMGPQQREWGFLVEPKVGKFRWIKHDHYLNDWKNYHKNHVLPKIKEDKAA